MTDERTLRASDLLGRTATGPGGEPIGRVVDLVCEPDAGGGPVVTAALVVRGRWGRLLGYEREQVAGPWIVEWLARRVLRHSQTTVPWGELRLADPT